MIDTDKALQELSMCGDRKRIFSFAEAVFDIAVMIETIFSSYPCVPGSRFEDSRERVSAAIEWALEFESKYCSPYSDTGHNDDWVELDYLETVDAFTIGKMKDHVRGL